MLYSVLQQPIYASNTCQSQHGTPVRYSAPCLRFFESVERWAARCWCWSLVGVNIFFRERQKNIYFLALSAEKLRQILICQQISRKIWPDFSGKRGEKKSADTKNIFLPIVSESRFFSAAPADFFLPIVHSLIMHGEPTTIALYIFYVHVKLVFFLGARLKPNLRHGTNIEDKWPHKRQESCSVRVWI